MLKVSYFDGYTGNQIVDLQQLRDSPIPDKYFTSHLEDIGDVTGVEVQPLHKISEGKCEVNAYILFDSRLPGPISCKVASVSLEKESSKGENGSSHRLVWKVQL